jgi:DNA modification methylase
MTFSSNKMALDIQPLIHGNHLYYGDNLTIMKNIPASSIDLIYLDPPFNSQRNYNLIYKKLTGQPVPEQEEAFCDAWEMDTEKEDMARRMPIVFREYGADPELVKFWSAWINALRYTQPRLLAYLIYMSYRLFEMHRILNSRGSIYLHCDPTASHYIKVIMDGIFGHENFHSEIVWRRTNSHNKVTQQYGPIHDIILFYSKSNAFTFHPGVRPYTKAYVEDRFTHHDKRGKYQTNYLTGPGRRNGESGKPWRGFDPTIAGRHWAIPKSLREFLQDEGSGMSSHEQLEVLYKQGLILFPQKEGGQPMYKQYVGKGMPYQDIWAYQPNTMGVLHNSDECIDEDVKYLENEEERLGYPTQKPIGLLKRIIETSTDPGAVVFDPFCGCGTAIYASHLLGRKWIGCDIAILAVHLIRDVLLKRYGLEEGRGYLIDGIPKSVEGARELFAHDPRQFQHWAVEFAGGFASAKFSGDRGIDGRIHFETKEGLRNMIISVKGGSKPTPEWMRELQGVVHREEDTELGGLICLEKPTKGIWEEVASGRTYEYMGKAYDRLQVRTIEDLFNGKSFDTPSMVRTLGKSSQIIMPV